MIRRAFHRSDRVASQIQKEVAEIIRHRLDVPKLGWVTVNAVEITRDLSLAKIYVTFLNAESSLKECLNQLKEYIPVFRYELAKRLRIRAVPDIRFLHDDSIERGMYMDTLLRDISGDMVDTEENDTLPP